MATSFRHPLAYRPSQPPPPPGSKRSRSPELDDSVTANSKRVRTTTTCTLDDITTNDKPTRQAARERRITEKEQQKAEFRDKYRRAFPSWTFYLDMDHIEPDRAVVTSLETRIQELGGAIEDFFSNQITHLITNQSLPVEHEAEKENVPKLKMGSAKPGHSLKSPIKLKGRAPDEALSGSGFHLVSKALSFGIKIWTTAKLDSVLNRCLENALGARTLANQLTSNSQRALTRLLQSERIHGISERDPTQKRHDFHYFSKSSYFVLVEDLQQELATVTAHEYEIPKSRDGKTPWPVLYCHPCARGPFLPFDEKEKKRWEKQQQTEKNRKDENDKKRILCAQTLTRKVVAEVHAKRSGDLRRSISLGNLHRRASYPLPGPQEGCLVDGDMESNNASGYLASAGGMTYVAASGNSISIASTTGTTSTTGYPLRNTQLSSTLSGRIRQQVLTSRRLSISMEKNNSGLKDGLMGPPNKVPIRQAVLRKSKSTNTLRLPKRDEGSKPGYCESCRVKFDDFRMHTLCRKHQKFAMDDANFLQLDCVLARVQRRTLQQLDAERAQRLERRRHYGEDGENAAI
ncbi:hypothetical protein APHAL10511_000078 [Amanita phalloides]|nr:hypothetical protein APHAL10511_000078 [Amanita phalloides]